MKKYCVVSFCNMYILPYASIYIDLIVKNGAECVLLFWDRDNTEGKNDNYPNCQKKCFSYKCDNNTNRINKVKGYLGAKSFFVNELCSEDYDGIIFLQTHAAISCYGVLKKKYIGKYIVDVRDWTLEHISVYRYIEEKCIKNSYRTVISSPAYKDFLPDFHYTVAHNFTPFSNETIDLLREKSMVGQRKQPLSISFVGTVRFIEMNQKILDIFSNDSRFKINYFGTGSNSLKQYCDENGIKNTSFYGGFSPELTSDFYLETDLINNLYGNHSHYLDYALSNKLYHAAQFYIPILVCPETYMEKIVNEYGIGFAFDVNDEKEKDRLIKWYQSINYDDFTSGCDRFLEKVKHDNSEFYELIDFFVNE